MVLYESALLGFFGGIVGALVGAVAVKILHATPALRGLLEPDLSIELLTMAVGIALFVGVVSGLYPAWRSSRLTPGPILRG